MEDIGALLIRLLFDDSQFGKQSRNAQGQFQQVGREFTRVAVGINTAVTGAFTAAAAALTGFVSASAVIGSGFERQIDVVGAVSQATVAELALLEARARELGATTSFTATQAGEALGVLAQAGKGVQESLQISGDALGFARAQSADLAAATELLVSTTNTFPDVFGDSARASDILTAATQKTQLNFERLGNALTFAGPQAAAFGISLEETTAALGAFSDIGLPASVAGTTFRQALVQAALATDDQRKVLAELGLTVEDINPETEKFTGIIENLAETTLTAAQSTALFGTRAGGAIATLVDATREGRVNIRQFTTEIEDSTGRTAATVERLSDNVATQALLVRSAVEDIFLSTFEAINEPLQRTLEAFAPFFNQVSESIAAVSDRIEQTIIPAVDRFTDALGKTGPDAADAFAESLVVAADVAATLLNTLTLLIRGFGLLANAVNALGIGPLISDLVVLVGIISSLGTAVSALAGLIGFVGGGTGLTAVTAGLGTVVTALGGPFGAAAVAVALVTIGFIQYAVAAREGEEATLALADALELVTERNAMLLSELTGQQLTTELREGTEAFAASQRDAALAGEQLTAVLEQELVVLEGLRDLSDEDIDIQIASGDLVVVGERLRTVSGIVEELDPETFVALEEAAKTFRIEAEAIERNLIGVRQRLDEAAASQEEFGRFGQAFEFGTEEATRQFIEQQEERAEAARRADENIGRQRDTATRELLARETRAAEERTRDATRQANRRAAVAEREADDRIKAAERAAKGIADALTRAETEGAGLFLGQPEQIQRELSVQEAAVRQNLSAFLRNFRGAQAAREEAVAQSEQTIEQLRLNASERLRLIDVAATERALELAQQRRDAVIAFTADETTASEQIRAQSADLITQIEETAAQQQQAIRERFAAQLAQADTGSEARIALKEQETAELASLEAELAANVLDIRIAANDDILTADDQARAQLDAKARASLAAEADTFRERVALFRRSQDDLLDVQERLADARLAGQEDLVDQLIEEEQRLNDEVESAASGVLDQIRDEPGPLKRAFGSVFEDLVESFPRLSRLFSDLGKVGTATADAISDAFKGLNDVVSAVTGGFDIGLAGTIAAAQEATGASVDAVAEIEQEIADLQVSLADAETLEDRQRILDDIAEQRAALNEARADLDTGQAAADLVSGQIDRAIAFTESLGANISGALTTFADRLPEIIGSISEGLTESAVALAEGLGPVIQSLVTELPTLISGITDAIVILIDALPGILTELLAGIPGIITSLALAVGDIITAVADALPGILTAITESLDDILIAIFDAIPGILTSIVSAIPDIIIALVEAIPDVIDAILAAIPTLIIAILELVPDLIIDLLAALPEIIEALLLGVVDIFTTIVSRIPEIVFALVEGLFGPEGLVSKLPEIVGQLFKLIFVELPKIAISVVKSIFTELIPALFTAAGEFVSAIFTEFIPNLIAAAKEFVPALAEEALKLGKKIGRTILNVLTLGTSDIFRPNRPDVSTGGIAGGDGIFTGGGFFDRLENTLAGNFGRLVTNIGAGIGNLFRGGSQGGIPFVARTTGTMVHAGEAILTAQQNRERLFGVRPGQGRDNPIAPVGAAGFETSSTGGNPFSAIRLQVSIGDRDLDRFTVEADQRGGLALSNKSNRRKTGTRVGFKRPGQK